VEPQQQSAVALGLPPNINIEMNTAGRAAIFLNAMRFLDYVKSIRGVLAVTR
jgi:hypothetical protein